MNAQTLSDVQVQELYAELSDLDDFDEEGWQDAYEQLMAMATSPQNINEQTFEELMQVPLLTEQQAAAILHYRSLYGDLHTMAELSLITAIDRPRQSLLASIFYAQPTKDNGRTAIIAPNDSVRALFRNGYRKADSPKNSLLFTLTIPTYQRQGYTDGTYYGYQYSHSLRLSHRDKHYQVGLTAAQDAGEPFFSGTNKKGWDFYTGYVRVKNIGALSNLVVGHYQMSIGMGLLMNNGFRMSRASLLSSSPSTSTVLRGHSSRMESNYLQGVAGTVTLPGRLFGFKSSLTAFASYRSLDATMSASFPPTVTTILTTGYHRTESEIARRASTGQTVLGGTLSLQRAPFRLSLNLLHVAMKDSLMPDIRQRYRTYWPQGKHFTSGSIAYAFMSPRLQFSGETALSGSTDTGNEADGKAAVATANHASWKVSDRWTLFALQRFYSYKFLSLLGKSFGDVSNVQNESGLYIGTTTTIKSLTLSAYADYAYHPWYRYGYNGSSRSWDANLTAGYSRRNISLSARYRFRDQGLTEGNSEEGKSMLQHTLRTIFKYDNGKWALSSQLQGTYLPQSSDSGFLFSQGGGYRNKAFSIWMSLAYFSTSDYVSRLYLTDRALTYAFPVFMVYGKGLRGNAICQAMFGKHISAAVRCGVLHYFDRSQISSGPQLIPSANQTDIQLQIGIKL